MYIPKENLMSENNEILDFMKTYSFATIITSKDEIPTATHLPFVVTLREDKIVLISHFAKANHQWKDIEKAKILVIFSEPHAYISTSHYNEEQNVPTWNYLSVHAYGTGKLITEPSEVMKLLETTIENYEVDYLKQWNNLPETYKSNMSKGIVGFEVTVADLQAKKKLSQSRTPEVRQRIINTLAASPNTNENLVAAYMTKDIVK